MSFVKQHITRLVIASAMLFAFAMPASAQEVKIGVVNVPALMQASPHFKAAMEALQEEFAVVLAALEFSNYIHLPLQELQS